MDKETQSSHGMCLQDFSTCLSWGCWLSRRFCWYPQTRKTSRCPAWDHLHISWINTQFPSALLPSQANGYLFAFQISFLLRDGYGLVQDLYPGIHFVSHTLSQSFPILYMLSVKTAVIKRLLSSSWCWTQTSNSVLWGSSHSFSPSHVIIFTTSTQWLVCRREKKAPPDSTCLTGKTDLLPLGSVWIQREERLNPNLH